MHLFMSDSNRLQTHSEKTSPISSKVCKNYLMKILNGKLHFFFNAVDLICLLVLFRTIKIARCLEEHLNSQKVPAHLFKEKNIMSVIPVY